MKKKSFLAYPYIIWSAIFIVIPLILVVLFSFTQKIDGKQVFSIANYRDLMDPIYFKVFLRSIILAGGSTCLLYTSTATSSNGYILYIWYVKSRLKI